MTAEIPLRRAPEAERLSRMLLEASNNLRAAADRDARETGQVNARLMGLVIAIDMYRAAQGWAPDTAGGEADPVMETEWGVIFGDDARPVVPVASQDAAARLITRSGPAARSVRRVVTYGPWVDAPAS